MVTDEKILKEKVIACLQTIFDPEIPVNIYELGLIYEINILPISNVQIVMTLTSPACPAAQTIPVEVDQKVRQVEGGEKKVKQNREVEGGEKNVKQNREVEGGEKKVKQNRQVEGGEKKVKQVRETWQEKERQKDSKVTRKETE